MTTLDDRQPATVQTTAEPSRPRVGHHAHGRGGGISSVLSREVSSRRSLLPGNVWTGVAVPVDDPEWLYLPGTPWSMRLACGSGGRPALEVYATGSLLDVVVASSRASQLLRGACAVVVAGQARTIAWGYMPAACVELPSIEFRRGRIRRRAQQEETEGVAGWFWFADTDGRFSRVQITSQRGRESCRVRMADAW